MAPPASSSDTKNASGSSEKSSREFNPRWKGYVWILFSSLVSFASITNVPNAKGWSYGILVGATTFALSLGILVLDRLVESFPYCKAADGKVEGYTLLGFVLWWIGGVAFLTRPDGLAYHATNIYFSSWIALGSCVYTLDQWSGSKDILSIQELVALSPTLSSWYVLFLSSMVVMGSAIHLHLVLSHEYQLTDSAFAIALGILSTLLACFFILVHYKFFSRVKQGGWVELTAGIFMIVCWTIGVAILTQFSGIASSLHGECMVVVQEAGRQIPGSNLYFASWFCLLASINIPLRWKTAQALQFAQASYEGGRKAHPSSGHDDDDDEEDDSI